MAKFDLGQFLADSGVNIDTAKQPQIEMISIDLIAPHPKNFYSIEGVDELANDILHLGLQEPLVVVEQVDGSVMIVSGHRRWNALKRLVEEGYEEYRDVPCIVDRDPGNTPELIELKLIHANGLSRTLSDQDLLEQDKRYRDVLERLGAQGQQIKGKKRDHIAQLCNVSTGKLARLEVIDKRLIPELKEKWRTGSINTDKAYNLARASEDMQKAELALMEHPPEPAKPSGIRFDAEAYQKRERQRIADLIVAAEWWLPTAFRHLNTDILYRNDVIEYIKREGFTHCGGCCYPWDYTFGLQGGKVHFQNSKISVTGTYTEFADALMIAAYRQAYALMQQLKKPIESDPLIVPPLRWNTGDPEEDGEYIVRVSDKYGTTIDNFQFKHGAWKFIAYGNETVIGWIPMPEDETGGTNE